MGSFSYHPSLVLVRSCLIHLFPFSFFLFHSLDNVLAAKVGNKRGMRVRNSRQTLELLGYRHVYDEECGMECECCYSR